MTYLQLYCFIQLLYYFFSLNEFSAPGLDHIKPGFGVCIFVPEQFVNNVCLFVYLIIYEFLHSRSHVHEQCSVHDQFVNVHEQVLISDIFRAIIPLQ